MKLYLVMVAAYRRDVSGGRFRVSPSEAVGPIVAETRAEVERYADAMARKLYPATAGFEGLHWHVCEVPDELVRQAALDLGLLPPQVPERRERTRKERKRGRVLRVTVGEE